MKTIFYVIIVLFMGANLVSCTADNPAEDELKLSEIQSVGGEDGGSGDGPG